MSSGEDRVPPHQPTTESTVQKGDPEWASGLKRLYDSVVDEPLPDSFKDLLSQLDDSGDK